MTFLCLETPAVISIIAVVLVQYALATFCLLKLAFLDVSKKEYVLWNLFILLIFFIGDVAFLIYWSKVKDKKRIPPMPPAPEKDDLSESGDVPEKGGESAPEQIAEQEQADEQAQTQPTEMTSEQDHVAAASEEKSE